MDELEKEILKSLKLRPNDQGLLGVRNLHLNIPTLPKEESIEQGKMVQDCTDQKMIPKEPVTKPPQNPLEGLLAQRVGCYNCGFVEGFSLIPFNCLTLPLGREQSYDIETLMDDYTNLEPIPGVECAHCTLLRHKQQLEQILSIKSREVSMKNGMDPALDTVYASAQARLETVLTALKSADFSETTLAKKCMISSKQRVTTTKSRQAVIARAPQALVLHVNRSIFNELTGSLSKNLASINFPKHFDLSPWCLGSTTTTGDPAGIETWETDPTRSMLSSPAVSISETESNSEQEHESTVVEVRSMPHTLYTLKAVVTHYGRHENGHYIAYRQGPRPSKGEDSKEHEAEDVFGWWRLSDDDVSRVSEEHVLAQGGVFMLFYERLS